ncbi:BrnA antitoxin family protein [Alphaproteobacteria bacterium KMM 3653]|uniref:BrnA antitoxin family protein n=1 Tax=Harenicola maris TaxID=2841044 RepID=A0AAP2CPF3_9RHOB|nr:BrnA antitoxin family protein [Harenicola maris]
MPVNLSGMTKTERLNYSFGIDALRMIETDIHDRLWDMRGCPPEWHEIAQDTDRRDAKRMRVTLSLDADVVRFFKALGPGYQPRMNRVLRAFMHMRLAKVVQGPDVNDYVLRPEEVERAYARRREEWGDTEAGL